MRSVSEHIILAKTIILSALMALSCTCLGQYSLQAVAHYGFIIPHRSGVANLLQGHVRAMELYGELQTNGSKHWHADWRYPKVGLAAFASDLGNPKQLGQAFALYPYIKFRVAGSERVAMRIKLGSGLGYVTKSFDAESNYKNVMIGSKLNIVASISTELDIKVSKRINLSTGLGLTHYSNGAFKVPNLGINVPTVSLGAKYSIRETERIAPIDSVVKAGGFEGIVFGTFGLKENYPIGSAKFPAYNIATEVSKKIGTMGKVTATFDLFHNPSIRPKSEPKPGSLGDLIAVSQQGVMLSYSMLIDRLSITFGQGYYLRTKYAVDSQFYQRIGVSYLVHKRIALRWMLKTYDFRADNFEMGIGYRFL